MGGRSRLVALTVALALALPSVGCGARWSDDQSEAVSARHEGGSGAATGSGTGASGRGSGTTGSATTTTVAAGVGGAAGGGATGGDSGASGTGPSGEVGASGPAPCAAASDAPGVTDTELHVGSIASLSGPVPGLGSSSAAAARAYVAYRNSAGGVCGRQIVLHEADDGTDSGRYRTIINDLGPQILGIAGGFAFGDVGAADVLEQQALPVVTAPSGEASSQLPTIFDINPGFADPHAVTGKYTWLHDHGGDKVALAYIAVDQSRYEANLQKALMEAAGIQVVLQLELPLSTLSYDSAARAVANSGANYLWFTADVNGQAAMARSMADTGYTLTFAEYPNFAYGSSFTDLAGPAAEGAVTFIREVPNSEAPSYPEMAAFLEWMDRTSPSDAVDSFAIDSWVSAKAFFDNLEALPGPITREALVTQLQTVHDFDAGGMYGPIDLGSEITNGCVVGLRYAGGTWSRLAPDSGFLC